MIQTDNVNTNGQQFLFLGQQWIEKSITEYRQSNQTISRLLRKRVLLPEQFFAAALLHIYMGRFSLEEIADLALVAKEELLFQRTQIDFLTLVDCLRVQFTKYFRDKLTSNVYTPAKYAAIAAEYAAFDEITRNQIRVPLYIEMRALAKSIAKKTEYDLPIDLSDLRNFQKLFSFFVFEQNFLPALAKPASQELFQIAKKIVWQRLEENFALLVYQLETDPGQYSIKHTLKRLFADLYYPH
jgi:hypothetical protein